MNANLRIKIRKILEENYDYYPDFFDPLYNPNVHGFIGYKDEEGLQTLGEEELVEGASNFSDIPESVGLIKSKGDDSKIWLHLFDFKDKKCVGHITLAKLSDRSYMLTTIAAEKGFGPIVLEMGMMAASPAGVCIDRVTPTRGRVWDMFDKFIDRSDIKKEWIEKTDMEYDDRFISDENRHFPMNVILFKSPSSEYNKLIENGAMLAKSTDMDYSSIANICRGYFSKRYEDAVD